MYGLDYLRCSMVYVAYDFKLHAKVRDCTLN